MVRLPRVIGVVLLVIGAGCGSQPAREAPAQTAEQTVDPAYDQEGALPLELRGRQQPDTAYVAIVLGPKGDLPCGATIIPDKLTIPNPDPTKPGPKKLKVEWEVVNYCWSPTGPNHEVSLEFDANAPIRWLKQVAEMPNGGPNKPGFENRDTIRARINNDAKPGTYNYVVMLKVGAADPVKVVDPELEIDF